MTTKRNHAADVAAMARLASEVKRVAYYMEGKP